MTQQRTPLPENQMGPAERMLELVLNSSAHLWHNRPGLDVDGVWHPAKQSRDRARQRGRKVAPGLHVPAAVALYRRLIEIYKLNPELMAHFASYALVETDWRDLKVACAALMLVQTRHGEPVVDDDGSVAFYDDDYRRIGEAMVLFYQRKSARMLTPKAVLRIAELLETPEIAALNREAGFADPAGGKPPLGRWKKAAAKWLLARETNRPMLEGLVKAGYKETLKKLARKVGYKPQSSDFFALLGWKQTQSPEGHREIGMGELELIKSERFDGLSEAEICETIVSRSLAYKEVVGRLPADVGLTPAIMAACLPSLSDRDLRQLTPTLEELGLMADADVRARWEKAVLEATDQRALNIAKNVRDRDLAEKLEQAADNAARKAVDKASAEVNLRVMFLIDKSGSMTEAIEHSKEALTKILAGFPLDKLHIASFDTMGTVLRPKAASRVAIQHMLAPIVAGGGTLHLSAVRALNLDGLKIPGEAKLIVIVVGDEAGENGETLAAEFRRLGYRVDAMALIVSAQYRGTTVRDCAAALGVPFSEVNASKFDDPYHVTRVLSALLEAPVARGTSFIAALVNKVMATPLLTL